MRELAKAEAEVNQKRKEEKSGKADSIKLDKNVENFYQKWLPVSHFDFFEIPK